MATLRTYSKRTPRAAAPLAPVHSAGTDWDELDDIISEGDSAIRSGKRKEDFGGKENTVSTFNQICNDETRPTKKAC
jgi:hypothetical protein